MLALRLIVAGAGWTLLTSAQLLEPPLQPATYYSPSGEYELFVDPTRRHGEGAGRYRMSYQGVELWSAEHPFTFQEAVVTDDGSCAGYAYSAGPRRLGKLVVAVLDPSGKVRLQESTDRTGSRYPEGAPNPRVHGALHQAAADFLLLRIPAPGLGNESWWRYRLSTGERLPDLEPKLRMNDPEFARWTQAAVAVPGTPLVLSQWLCQDYGSRFCLTDPGGEFVWQLDLPRDYALADYEARRQLDKEIWAGGAILTTGPGPRFELRFVTRGERVSFEVAPGPNGWRVTETGSRPYEPAQALAVPEPKIQDLEPVELGRVRFDALTVVDAVTVDDAGRVYLIDKPTGAVHVFDCDGTALRVCHPNLGDQEEGASDPWMGVAPTAGELWTCDPHDIEVFDERGIPIRRFERTAAGEWLVNPLALGVAPDGFVVVVDQAGPALHFYGPWGTPLGQVDLPSESVYWTVAFDGTRAMLISDAQELLLVALDGSPIQRIPTGLRSIGGFFFSPDGAEIWVFPYQEAEMIRFALP